jgi:hypothetical protein
MIALLVTDYWQCRGVLATEALRLAALPPSGADIERISQRRAPPSTLSLGVEVETLSDRLFVKTNKKQLPVVARVVFRGGQAVLWTGGLKAAPA